MSEEADDQERERAWTRRLVFIAANIWLVLEIGALLLSFLAFPASFLIFDAPGSENVRLTWMFACAFWSLPLVAMIGITFSIIAASTRTIEALVVATIIPAAWILYLVAVDIALDIQCNGNFACR